MPTTEHTYIIVFFATSILSLFMCINLFAQEKLEREYRIPEQQVPQTALDFINKSFPDARIKWYGEESLTGKTIEAKIKSKPNFFSIEFDTLGNLQDVELLIDFDRIEPSLKATIEQQLEEQFIRHHITRSQVQWHGSNQALHELITNGETSLPYTTRYEIILRGKSDKDNNFYEFLFDDNGKIVRSSIVVQRNTNNLFY